MLALPFSSLKIFVATRREDVPAGCVRTITVDGTVPGYTVRWDHHTTGERVNLDAMPDTFDASGFDGVGTTLADTDAVASVVAVLFGGKAKVPAAPRGVLESASHWCDYLSPHPAHDQETNRLGRGLHDAISERLAGAHASVSQRFAATSRALATTIARGEALPYSDRWPQKLKQARAVLEDGRLRILGPVALVDLSERGDVDPLALYTLHDRPIGVTYSNHSHGGIAYTVGVNPLVASRPTDLGPALRALAAAEFAHGPPTLGPEPTPGNENWGGRATVFGSPWNHGSRLKPEEVVALVRDAMSL